RAPAAPGRGRGRRAGRRAGRRSAGPAPRHDDGSSSASSPGTSDDGIDRALELARRIGQALLDAIGLAQRLRRRGTAPDGPRGDEAARVERLADLRLIEPRLLTVVE